MLGQRQPRQRARANKVWPSCLKVLVCPFFCSKSFHIPLVQKQQRERKAAQQRREQALEVQLKTQHAARQEQDRQHAKEVAAATSSASIKAKAAAALLATNAAAAASAKAKAAAARRQRSMSRSPAAHTAGGIAARPTGSDSQSTRLGPSQKLRRSSPQPGAATAVVRSRPQMPQQLHEVHRETSLPSAVPKSQGSLLPISAYLSGSSSGRGSKGAASRLGQGGSRSKPSPLSVPGSPHDLGTASPMATPSCTASASQSPAATPPSSAGSAFSAASVFALPRHHPSGPDRMGAPGKGESGAAATAALQERALANLAVSAHISKQAAAGQPQDGYGTGRWHGFREGQVVWAKLSGCDAMPAQARLCLLLYRSSTSQPLSARHNSMPCVSSCCMFNL